MKTKQNLELLTVIVFSFLFLNCSKEETITSSDEFKYGYLQFYQATNLGFSPLSVYINGNFEGTFSSIDPDGANSSTCEIDGFSKKLEAGTYNWKITGANTSGTVTWENTTTVKKYGLCSTTKLTLQ